MLTENVYAMLGSMHRLTLLISPTKQSKCYAGFYTQINSPQNTKQTGTYCTST